MKILAVDDDEFILELLEAAMASAGYPDMTTASSGAEALNIVANTTEPFDCFLFDIQMPEMDGIELCTHIRQIETYRKTPILMITAMSEREYVDRAFAAGATDYVTKPFDVLELGTRVAMAERLVNEINKARKREQTLDVLTEKLVSGNIVSIADPLDVDDVHGFLNYPTFENYILQLGRGNYFSSSIFALKITNIKAIYDRCKGAEFEFVITDIADAISENLKGETCFFTYAGNGVFLCVFSRFKDLIQEDLPYLIQDTAMQMGLVFPDGSPLEIRLIQGEPKSPGVFSKPGSLSVLDDAIRDVEMRHATRDDGTQKAESSNLWNARLRRKRFAL